MWYHTSSISIKSWHFQSVWRHVNSLFRLNYFLLLRITLLFLTSEPMRSTNRFVAAFWQEKLFVLERKISSLKFLCFFLEKGFPCLSFIRCPFLCGGPFSGFNFVLQTKSVNDSLELIPSVKADLNGAFRKMYERIASRIQFQAGPIVLKVDTFRWRSWKSIADPLEWTWNEPRTRGQ